MLEDLTQPQIKQQELDRTQTRTERNPERLQMPDQPGRRRRNMMSPQTEDGVNIGERGRKQGSSGER